jgi:hypothetical protein
MPRDVDVGSPHLVARRKIGQRKRHLHIARHELQHTRVEPPHGMTEQAAQVGLAPGIGGAA